MNKFNKISGVTLIEMLIGVVISSIIIAAMYTSYSIINNILNVTVDFVSEVITCIRDKDKKIVSGDPEKIKKIYDTWVFSRDTRSSNPNWQLVDILT